MISNKKVEGGGPPPIPVFMFATQRLCLRAVDTKWHLFDAKNKVLGRLASSIVPLLTGKNKPNYTPENLMVCPFYL